MGIFVVQCRDTFNFNKRCSGSSGKATLRLGILRQRLPYRSIVGAKSEIGNPCVGGSSLLPWHSTMCAKVWLTLYFCRKVAFHIAVTFLFAPCFVDDIAPADKQRWQTPQEQS